MEGGAYGSAPAGAPFNPLVFIKKPHVITRCIALVFAIIVFGCIASRGFSPDTKEQCLFNLNGNACNYGIGIGVLAFLICILFLVVDALFDQISNVNYRKYAVIADIGVSGLWSFLWFVGFCYLADQWRRTTVMRGSYGRSDVQAAIAFSFFSVISWVVLTVLAVLRYRKGVAEEFSTPDQYDRPDIAQSSNPYASFGGEVDQSYQQAPFSGNDTSQAQPSNYQPPTY